MKSHYVRSLAIAALAILGILPVAAQAPLVDLGVAMGYAVNNAGQVVLSTGIYSDGAVTPLPALPGQTTAATGVAINAAGQVAGSAPTSIGNSKLSAPVEFSSGTLTILKSPMVYADNYTSEGYATGINSSAETIGVFTSPDVGPANIFQGYNYNGFISANGKLVSLPASGLPSTNMPAGINDSSQITGVISNEEYGLLDAYVYDYPTGTTTDLGPGAGYAINNAGQVTGTLDEVDVKSISLVTITGSHAFLYSNGTAINLGKLPGAKDGTGYAINAAGQVVGSSGGHAFFYNGVMNDLNALIVATDPLKAYVTLTSAVGINDGLLILANGVDSRTGKTHAYLYQASFVQLAPATLDFAMQAVGGTSNGQSVTITNAGSTTIPIGTAYVDGDFSLRVDTCGTSLAPGGQCRIAVVFVPEVIGVLTGALTIPSAGANYQVPLSGIGTIAATFSASSTTATVGQPLTLTWAVTAGATCIAGAQSTNPRWIASKPPFAGKVALSGKQTLTEAVDGTMGYILDCTAPGVPAVNMGPTVIWTWPAVNASISASPTTITAGKSTTLTWTSSNATSCTATGGGADDNWPGTKATSGSQTATEAVALDTSSVVLTFGITCSSTTTGLSGQATVSVTEDQASAGSGAPPPPPTSSGGGGGALNPLSLVLLAGLFALRRARVRILSS